MSIALVPATDPLTARQHGRHVWIHRLDHQLSRAEAAALSGLSTEEIALVEHGYRAFASDEGRATYVVALEGAKEAKRA